jgi:hypothetical protein
MKETPTKGDNLCFFAEEIGYLKQEEIETLQKEQQIDKIRLEQEAQFKELRTRFKKLKVIGKHYKLQDPLIIGKKKCK